MEGKYCLLTFCNHDVACNTKLVIRIYSTGHGSELDEQRVRRMPGHV